MSFGKKSTKNFPVKEENSALRDELLESSENNLRCSGEEAKKMVEGGGRWMEVGYGGNGWENVLFFFFQMTSLTTL